LAPSPGEITFAVARQNLAGSLVVADDEARQAIRFAFHELKQVLEPGGAVALAAVLTGRLPTKGRTIAVVLSGGNIDPRQFAEIICS
jgi:threonine dehydratase